MKKRTRIILISILSFIFLLGVGIGIYAYYEYYGQYSNILNIDGTIKLDAFDVLYPDLREDKDSNGKKTYGRTPENPYVIDSALRLKNLIRLNNSGKLKKSKEKDGIDKYYFCLQFDAQEIAQVLDLSAEGEFSSIGNNEYPFIDELSGVVYGYEITSGNYVYYSGCLPEYKTYTLTGTQSQASQSYSANATYYRLLTGSDYEKVRVEEDDFDSLKANLVTAQTSTESTTYYYAKRTYNSSLFDSSSVSAAINSVDLQDVESYIPASSLTPIHQAITNETIVADLEQVDVGFISSIGNGGYVHDLIIYNEKIKCKETNSKDLFNSLKEFINSLMHKTNYEDKHDERHVGLFCGHIEDGGNAYNISVGGTADLQINTKSVNYFSNYTTVGFIENSALIGGKLFSEIATDSLLDGDCAGVLFADSIYGLTSGTQDSGSTYALTSIAANSETGWPGTDGNTFKYGSFTFLLSASTDVVSSIWNGTDTFLGQNGKNVYSYALYCSDEYRYSPDTQSGSSFNQASASLKETIYDGLTSLSNSGNVIDPGKYIIVAHVGNNYYALKMAGQTDGTNTTYYFDTTAAINVTAFLNDSASLYQSCLWEVAAPSSTPTFENSRFEGKYLTINGENVSFTTNSAAASSFGVDIQNSLFYYDETSGSTDERYYLNFDSTSNEFYFDVTPTTEIDLFQISSGYDIAEVTSYANIVEDGQYFIAAYYNNNYYLIGTATNDRTVLQSFSSDALLSTVTAYTNSFTTTMTVDQYTTYSNYIWRANKNNNTVSFIDKLSSSYYLSTNGSDVTLSTNQIYWDYNGYNNGTSLDNGGNYLTAVYSASPANNTCFDVTTASGYRIFLLSITPEDSTPPYISYDGAKYIDAESSTIECGDYVLVADYENNKYAIGIDSNGVVSSTVDVNNFSLDSTKYVYNISNNGEATTSSLLLSNKNIVVGTTTIPTTITETVTGSATTTQTITENSTSFTTMTSNNIVNAIPGYNSSWENLTYTVTLSVSMTNSRTGSSRSYYLGLKSGNTIVAVTSTTSSNGNSATASGNCTNYLGVNLTCNSGTSATNLNGNYARINANTTVTYTISYSYTHSYAGTETIDVYGCLSGENATLSVSSNSFCWYYDAINLYVYCYVNDTKYYLNYGVSGAYLSTIKDTHISLYQYQTQYTYEDVTRITSDAGMYNQRDAYFLISTLNLHNTSLASVLVGTSSSTDADGSKQSDVKYFSMQGNYSVSAPTNGVESDSLFNLTTTSDLSYFRWKLAGYLRYNSTSNYYSIIYNDGFESVGSQHKYLSANNISSNRQLCTYLSTKWNYRYGTVQQDYLGDGYENDSSYGANGMDWSENGASTFAFRGSGANYGMFLGDDGKSVKLGGTGGNATISNSDKGTPIYFYYCNSIVTDHILTLVSSDGDTLEENIHYALVAKSGDDYYAMTYDASKSIDGITGTEMTQQVNLIMSSGQSGYTNLTTVPSNCDFEQVSNNYELRFKHYNSSTTSSYNYLDFTNSSNHYITTQANNVSYESINAMFYDIINKRLSFISNATTYYITYDAVNNVFGYTTVAGNASKIELIRYTPSYKVTLVSDLTTEDLSEGQYIIAGHSDNGYLALGEEVSTTDITRYLTSTMSEADYNSLLEFVWNQLYYDFNNTYDSDIAANKINFMFSNAKAGTGFQAYSNGSTAYWGSYSSSSKWELTVNNGIWTFKCNIGVGTELYMYFTASGTNSDLTMSDTYGAIGKYISSQNSVAAEEDSGTQVVLYRYDSSNSTNPYTVAENITSGNQYVMFIRTNNYYYLVSYNNNTYTTTQVGKNLNGVATKITNANVNNYLLTATSGTYGYSLRFGSTSYYLSVDNNDNLVASTTATTWDYYYNGTYLNKCRLYTVSSANVSGMHLDVSGSKVATATSTETYLYTVEGTSGAYTLGSIATSISTSNKYAILIFKNGLYYTVANDGLNEVMNIGYNAAIPTSLSDEEIFSVEGSTNNYHFYQTVDTTKYYLVIGGDSTLTFRTSILNSSFSFTGSTGSVASYTHNQSGSGAGVYLFKVEKNDELDATSDVTVTLTGHAEVTASLSVNQTGKYIIVASYDNEDYVLGMINYDESIALDISEQFEDALDGDAISIFKAAIFEQLGTDYSLVFNSLAFTGSSYYLLDGRFNSQNETKPTVAEYSLYDSNTTYYTVGSTAATAYEAGADYYTYSNNTFTLDSTVDSNTNFNAGTTYYILEVEEFEDDFVSGVTYYTYDSSTDTYTKVNYETDTTVLNVVKDDSNYIWTIYTYAVTGGTSYVLGYYDSALDKTYYLYFDQTNKAFKLTDDVALAKEYQVQIYMLGEEAESQPSYQTFNIELEDDKVTIASFPLTEITASEFKQYSSTASTSIEAISGKTVKGIIPGEYLIAAKEGKSYYALSLSSSSSCVMSYADVSLYFGGTFERDMNGYYCISVNTKYIWKQQAAAGSFTYNETTGVVSGLNFLNYAYNVNLCYSGNATTGIYYDGTHVYLDNNSTRYYLHFENGTGFTWITTQSDASEIVFFSVGAIAQAASGETATNYTYYTESIDKLDYTNFAFSEKQISELQNYANAFGTYEYTTGWLVNSNTTLTEVHDSVYFKSGIPYGNDVSTFASLFSSIEYSYEIENGLVTQTNTLTYYAPKGTASFAVADASDADPVYVNVMVSTQLDTNSLAANIRRYLSLYKVATIDYETNTLETYEEYETSTTSAAAFAKTLLEYRYTPYAAIPLPNSQDTTDTTAAADYVKVGETGYQLSEYGDHLIAHTFIITEPGVYYLGSTAGSVAFSYLSIDKMKSAEQSEDSSVTISEDFTIDYVWGSLSTTDVSVFDRVNLNVSNTSTLDSNMSTLTYVGRRDSSDSLTWTHSNIYPEFVVGTAGIKDVASGTDYYTISLTDVESSRITSFDSSVDYYTYNNGVYTKVDQLTTAFDSKVEYYIISDGNYVLVNAVPTNGTTYYYVTLTPEGDITLTPQVGGTDIVYFMSTRKYYTLTATKVNISEFDSTVAYYTVDSDGIYTLTYNPTDYLRMTLSRAYVSESTSRLTVNYYTVDEIINYGYGVMYINANKNSLKPYRLISFVPHVLASETNNFQD